MGLSLFLLKDAFQKSQLRPNFIESFGLCRDTADMF